ncbi:sulfotransferase [Winogradskyella sp. SYSU M77433]|uniref:sulfotransferase family protein n=1 Tax=Winogradskyella sp. SYSU M77433 TaxID=3042722 RepID=UPI002480CE90|nr:sulfotransferase [Winogradskyella sp. SYSU M77433]MDH7911524.1 sulfotransferase [Winogradskyella sp. SYSU M77433]
MTDNNLIFIASQPRSGSTLLQALLSNNELVGTVSEPWLLLPFLSYNRKDLIDAKYQQQLAIKGISEFLDKTNHNSFKTDMADFILKQYHKIIKNNEKYVLDKTPRYYEILDEILEYFPNSKIIILKRHPLSVLKSIIKTWRVRDIDKLLDFKRDVLNAPFIIHNFQKKNKDNPNVYCLRYEDLVKDPSIHLKSIYNWVGLDYNENILDYSENKKFLGRLGDPTGIKTHSEPNKGSIENWDYLLQDKYWSEFLKGYLNYLKPNFLREYGEYELPILKIKDTFLFDVFLQKSEWNFLEHEPPKIKLIKYSILRHLGKFRK